MTVAEECGRRRLDCRMEILEPNLELVARRPVARGWNGDQLFSETFELRALACCLGQNGPR